MAIAPFLETFVEIRHQLEEDRGVRLLAVEADQILLHPLVGDGGELEVASLQGVRDRGAATFEKLIEVMDQGWLEEPSLQPGARLGLGGVVCHHLRPLVAQQELELAELPRLEARSRFEPVTEGEERHGGHGFENIELAHQRLHHHADALEGGDRPEEIVGRELTRGLLEFVDQQLEPELVDLVDDDEQHFIVLRRTRFGFLEPEESVELEVVRVRDGHDPLFRARTAPPAGRPE